MRLILLTLLILANIAYARHRKYHYPEDLIEKGLQFDVDTSANDIIIEARCAIPDNKERTGNNTQWWGIAWNNDTDSLILRGRNTAYGDFTDTQVLDLIHKRGGKEQLLGCIKDNANLPSGAHSLAIEWHRKESTNVSAGAKQLTTVPPTTLPLPLYPSARIITSPDTKIEIASVVTEWTDNPDKYLHPPFPQSCIDSIIRSSGVPIAGYWRYLDRETDDELARPGGKYTLAIVPYRNEIFILYIDGAKILTDSWNRGMIKGRLHDTPFLNHYDLTWYGSEMKAIDDECYATFDSEGVMTCVFPLHKSQLRFYKIR